MSIHKVVRDRPFKITKAEQALRPGQIVEGSILKLYPNNKAQIKLGSQIMVAQLEASLTIGKRYHFQVKETGQITRLKVLGEELTEKASTNTIELMKTLQLKINKNTMLFIQQLLEQGISFERSQVMKALQMIDSVNDKFAGTKALLEMMERKLPMQDSIFQALLSKQTTTFTEQSFTLLQYLRNIKKPTPTEQNLIHQLSQIREEGTTWNKNILVQTILNDLSTEKQQLFQILKASGVVKKSVSQTSWNNTWQQLQSQLDISPTNVNHGLSRLLFNMLEDNGLIQTDIQRAAFDTELNTFLKQENIVQLGSSSTRELQKLFNYLKSRQIIRQNIDFSAWSNEIKSIIAQQDGNLFDNTHQRLANISLPYINDIDQLMSSLIHIQNTPVIKQAATNIVNNWANTINRAVIQNKPLESNEFTQFIKDISEQLNHNLLPQEQLFNQIKNNASHLRLFLTSMQALGSNEAYEHMDKLIASMKSTDPILPLKKKFLIHIQESLKNLGVTHENQVVQNNSDNQVTTIKSMLIDMISTGNTRSERMQPLLHLINGVQLQSVHETSNFIQANLQVPGGPLTLNNDLYLEFESHKTDDGKVDPNYCRILFYLELASLKETIIDMRIQKRTVAITIFNDNENIKAHTKLVKPMLKEGLEKLDYKLSTVLIKKLQEESLVNEQAVKENPQKPYEGFDFKV